MKKNLEKIENEIYHYVYGVKISGDVSGISGDVSGISGDVSGISGDVSGISGNVSGIIGNVDLCEITDEERKNGVDINDLIK